MDLDNLETLIAQWKRATRKVKREEYITDAEIMDVFKATYKAFNSLHGMELVPREACQIIMLMDEFTYFADSGDENYLGEYRQGLYYLNYALKYYFFKGKYRSEFFMGEYPPNVKKYVLDIENISLDDFVLFLKDEVVKDFRFIVFPDNK